MLWYSELNCHMWHQHPIWELVHFRSGSLIMYPEKSSRRWFPPPMWKTGKELLAPGLGLTAPVHWGHLESGPPMGDFITLTNQNIIFPHKMAFFFHGKKLLYQEGNGMSLVWHRISVKKTKLSSHHLDGKMLNFIYLLGERHSESFVCSFIPQKPWTRIKSESRDSNQVSHMGGKTCLPRCASAGIWDWKQS